MSVLSGFESAENIREALTRIMFFIDGTNFYYRFKDAGLQITEELPLLLKQYYGREKLVRTYFYTSDPYIQKMKNQHNDNIFNNVRVVKGLSIPSGKGNDSGEVSRREKAVDALMVADLVYHAAQKNYDLAIIISADQDFVYSIKRVDDFGCRTKIISFVDPLADNLKNAADMWREVSSEELKRLSIIKSESDRNRFTKKTDGGHFEGSIDK